MPAQFIVFARVPLFIAAQGLCALALFVVVGADVGSGAEAYWILFPIPANAVVMFFLYSAQRKGAFAYTSLFTKFERLAKKDVGALSVAVLVSGFLAMVPTVLFARLLYGSPEAVGPILFRPLPLWAILLGFLWPLTQPFAELPFYFSYCLPRLEAETERKAYPFLLTCFALTVQHIFLPFILDLRYIAWRFASFAFISFFFGFVIKANKKLLPYLLVLHAVLDLPVVFILLLSQRG